MRPRSGWSCLVLGPVVLSLSCSAAAPAPACKTQHVSIVVMVNIIVQRATQGLQSSGDMLR
jgi:hypothetical protein